MAFHPCLGLDFLTPKAHESVRHKSTSGRGRSSGQGERRRFEGKKKEDIESAFAKDLEYGSSSSTVEHKKYVLYDD